LAKKAKVYTGTEWVDLAAATTDLSGYPALATNQFGFRNKIINGDFRINQRAYTSASNLASGSYGFDRWKSTFTNTTLTFTSAPQGQIVTINSGGSVEQVIERENMPAGTYVLSWTGTATGRVYNTGATPPSYAASPVLVTLDGTANVEVEFTASGGTRTLQNVQLEAGSVPSAFERRPIGTELALCQRYYLRYNSGTSSVGMLATPLAYTAAAAFASVLFPVDMRTGPIVDGFNTVTVGDGISSFGNFTGISVAAGTSNSRGVLLNMTGGSGMTATRMYNTYISSPSGFLALSAEL
jgi:hypothetical protein